MKKNTKHMAKYGVEVKFAILFIFVFAMVSCVDKTSDPEEHYSHKSPAREKISKEKAVEIAKNDLLKKGHINEGEQLRLFDKGDYYTVTVDLPPLALGGGWAVDLDCYSGKIIRVYFTE